MPVNRVEKLIINHDTAMPVACAWADCERRARTPYQIIHHQHPPSVGCSWVDAAGGAYGGHYHYAFCSEGCKDLWAACTGESAKDLADRNRGLIAGMHSAGMKGTVR